MLQQIVILSGPVGSGKTTLARNLHEKYGLLHVKSSDYLIEIAAQRNVPRERGALQKLGESLDRKTHGEWVVEGLRKRISDSPSCPGVVVDAVRIQKQINAIRGAFGANVVHIHLKAPTEELAARYTQRSSEKIEEFKSYSRVRENKTERKVPELASEADVVIDTKLNTEDDVVIRAAGHLGLYGREYLRLVDVLVGGQFGSEGKGQIASYLSREYDFLVRVGGPNAGHTVPVGPIKKTFHQLPSGTLTSTARLIIGPGAVVNVRDLLQEIGDCDVEASRISIDPQVMTISPQDISGELELKKDIGSTGRGVGFATARRIKRRGKSDVKLARDIPALRPYIRDTCEVLERAYHQRQRVLLEGTQGTGLSIYHGYYPHVTSRDTTVAGCLAEAGISPSRVRKVLMVCRTYPIRVQSPKGGTSGFMSQPITWNEVARRAHLDPKALRKAEKTSTTKRNRRVAEFDWLLLRKSATLNAPTDIALTFTDYISGQNEKARRFEQLTPDTLRFIEEVERVAAAPVSLISTRFGVRSIIDRRAW